MSLLDVENDNERAANARLILVLDELSEVRHDPWSSLREFATLCGIATEAAARRRLYRVKVLLREHGVVLPTEETMGEVSVRFGTRAIRNLIEVDLRKARRIVETLDAKREGRKPDLKGLGREVEVVNADAIHMDYFWHRKSFAWIMYKYEIGVGRLTKILTAGDNVGVRDRRERVRIEDLRPEAAVAEALAILKKGALLAEVEAILKCSRRTAARFVERHGFRCLKGTSFAVPINCDNAFWVQALERLKPNGSSSG
jgi:hypothetical protein